MNMLLDLTTIPTNVLINETNKRREKEVKKHIKIIEDNLASIRALGMEVQDLDDNPVYLCLRCDLDEAVVMLSFAY